MYLVVPRDHMMLRVGPRYSHAKHILKSFEPSLPCLF